MPKPIGSVRRGVQALCACAFVVASTALAAAPAEAFVLVNPTITGSGSVLSSVGVTCSAPQHTPTGTGTTCGQIVVPSSGGFVTVTLTAVPQPTPAGHWQFVGWTGSAPGCAGATTLSCTITVPDGAGPYSVNAAFRDLTPPTLTVGNPTYSTTVDRTATLTWTANEALSAVACKIDGVPLTSCGLNSQTLTLSEGSHTFSVQGTDSSGNGPGAAATMTFWIVDTALAGGPPDYSNDPTPDFTFSSLTGIEFECSIDTPSLSSCGGKGPNNLGSATFGPLPDGTHTFRVRARNGSDFDRVPVVRTWVIDTVPPVATLSGGPGEGALQASDTETFTFASNEPDGSFECRLDAAPFAPCASTTTLRNLPAGAHRFELRAIDRAGNASAAVARNWAVAPRDRDGDGFNELVDCDDANPAIRPGAREVPGNTVDENCDGIVAKPPRVKAKPSFSAQPGRATTRFKDLRVKGVPAGATVTVTCKGSGCPKRLKGKRFTTKLRATGAVSLKKLLAKPLKRGTVLTIVAAKPPLASTVVTLRVRAGKQPLVTTRCQAPDAKAPGRC